MSKLNENPDFLIDPTHKVFPSTVWWMDPSAYAFGFYNNILYVKKSHRNIKIGDKYISRKDMDYSGRIWLNQKIISFWKYPESNIKLKDIVTELEKYLGIKIWNNGYRIEIISNDDGLISFDAMNKSSEDGDWDGEKIEFIPLESYNTSINPKNVEHVMSPTQKMKFRKNKEADNLYYSNGSGKRASGLSQTQMHQMMTTSENTARENFKIDEKQARIIGKKIGVDFNKINIKDFIIGLNTEFEHINSIDFNDKNSTKTDILTIGRIAFDHLKESPLYYKELEKMEKKLEIENKIKSFVKKQIKEVLSELSINTLINKSPRKYKIRATTVTPKLIGKTKHGKYIYKTITSPSGNVHKQTVKPAPPNTKITNTTQNVIVSCDCGNNQYENEYVLWKSNSSHIEYSNGSSPLIRNPKFQIKLCKHLLAVLEDLKKRIYK